MLSIRATLKGLDGNVRELRRLHVSGSSRAAKRTVTRIARHVFAAAFRDLSGPGRKSVRLKDSRRYRYQDGNIGRTAKKKTRASGQSDQLGARPGSYPVPVITGNLRQKIGWIGPGESISAGGMGFATGPAEAAVYDSAEYARPIHEGTGSSAPYGPRPYITGGMEGVDAVGIAQEEYGRETG